MISKKNQNIIEAIKQKDLTSPKVLADLLDMAKAVLREDESETEYCFKISKFVKESVQMLPPTETYNEIYWNALLFEAPYIFDSYVLYMEKNREPKKRFYQPRRKTLKIIAADLQDLEDGVIDFLGVSLPPRTGKSTLCIFFLSWIMGKRPNSHNAMSGHSGILADGFYSESLNLTTSADYTFGTVFPNVKLQNKSAEKNEITLDKPDRFATLTCRGIDGTWTGAVDISNDGYLYVDDLVRDRTESLSPVRLEGRYQDYLNVLVDRKNDGSKELMVGTRWNVIDPLGRVEKENKDNPKYRFRKIPALNENGQSNFEYEYRVGFSTEYFEAAKARLDKNEWEAKYQQNPFIREGLLFPESELRTYNGVLPEFGLIRKVGVGDIAWGGGDSLSLPFGYEYDDGFIYIPDWIFNKGDKETTYPIVTGRSLHHQPSQLHFEANNGGDVYADEIDRRLRIEGFKTNITSKKADNQMSKLAKIIQYAPDIKNKFVFLEEKLRSKEYQDAMDELTMFVQIGKNAHDDSPDSLAQLAKFLDNGIYAKIEIPKMQRYF